jgi:predicted SnoaL-like aldol condensation-catalyzing enzyme
MKNKDSALDFLKLIRAGKIDEAYEKYIDMSGKHHNVYTPAGFAALKEGMKGAAKQFPDMQFEVKHVAGDDEMVATHSFMKMEKDGNEHAVVHLFRFKNSKIVELWDVAQTVPNDSPNTDGMF